MFANKHSTSSLSIVSLLPILIAAPNSAIGILVRRTAAAAASFASSKPPAMKTLRSRLRNAMSRPRSSVRYMRRLTNSSSPATSAVSNPDRSPFLMQRERGRKRFCKRGYGDRRVTVGRVWVVSRWQGMRYVRMSLCWSVWSSV